MTVSEHMAAFDPSEFGIVNSVETNSRGNNNVLNKNYIILQADRDSSKLVINITRSVGLRVISELGKSVNFGYDASGNIFLWPGAARKLTLSTKNANHYSISIAAITKEYIKKMGEFRRLYLKPEFYGSHVKLSITGERDAI